MLEAFKAGKDAVTSVMCLRGEDYYQPKYSFDPQTERAFAGTVSFESWSTIWPAREIGIDECFTGNAEALKQLFSGLFDRPASLQIQVIRNLES